jgi:NADH-quinone oxidoreductase subunit E
MAALDELRSTLAAEAAEIIGRYPKPRSALMPLLHLVQSEVGYVSEDGIRLCAELLGLAESYVRALT